MTAHSLASTTTSALWSVSPSATMRPCAIKRSPRTIRFDESTVTNVPFLMRIEDIATKTHEETLGEHKSSPPSAQLLIPKFYFLSVAVAAFAVEGSGGSRTAMPSFTFTSLSIRFSTSGFSFSAVLAFSRPWPSRSLLNETHAPLLHHPLIHCEVEQVTFTRNALAVHDVKLTLAERRRHFVLRHLHLRAIANHAIAVFDRANATNVEPQRRIKLQRRSEEHTP